MAKQRHDLDLVIGRLPAWLCAREPEAGFEVLDYQRPAVGFSGETVLLDIRRVCASEHVDERMVLKLPPAGAGIFPTYDFALQAAVQSVVADAGVPAPAPAQAESDTRWLGVPFLVMPAIVGHIVDEVPIRDRWLTTAAPELNDVVHGGYFDLLAKIHAIDWRAAGLATLAPIRDNLAEIVHWRRYLAWLADGVDLAPVLTDALDWCEDNRPASEPSPSLLWGDVRLGNVIFDDSRAPVAVLDWEMSSIGAAEHDLAWALAIQAIQAELFGRSVPGFLDRAAAIARYEAGVGRSMRDFAWYEILAIVRSTAIMVRVSHLQHLAGEPVHFPIADNPILGILRRRIAESKGPQ